MKKLLLKTCATVLTGVTVLIPALRGFYLLHHERGQATEQGHEFLMALANELERYSEDHGGRFPDRLNALPLAHRDREGIGIQNLWGGVLRARLADLPQAIRNVRAGLLLDPWGEPWRYSTDATGSLVRVESGGADRAPGGHGDGADLVLTKRGYETALSTLGHDPLW